MSRVVVVSGLSGSGKTLALRSLEDLGYFCVDNLPVPLIEPFVDLLDRGSDEEPRGAFVVDARERQYLAELPHILDRLRRRDDVRLTVLFLEAAEDTLVRRFSESRRPHPLSQGTGLPLVDAVRREADLLCDLRAIADRVVATDDLSPHELRRLVQEILRGGGGGPGAQLRCRVVSFGFKYGLPRDADLVFDARFLPNPYFDPALRTCDGRDPRVVAFLERSGDWREYLERLVELLGFLLPRFVDEGKSYLNVAVGCTGGRHRSVAIAEHLGAVLRGEGFPVVVQHRDLEREGERIGP